MPGRWIALLVVLLSLTGGLVLLRLLPDGKDPAGASGPASVSAAEVARLRSTVARLEAELAKAVASNRALEEEIDWLREEARDLAAARDASRLRARS